MKTKMLIILWLAVLCLAVLPAGTGLEYSCGITNDNQLLPYEWAIHGWTIGPDDFLTYGLFLDVHYYDFQFTVNMETITSRLAGYRYDLLFPRVAWDFQLGNFTLTPELGAIFSGDFGGEQIQNGWHYMIGYPLLMVEEEDFTNLSQFSLAGQLALGYRIGDLLWPGNQLDLRTSLHCSWNLLPCYWDLGLTMPLAWRLGDLRGSFEFLLGGRVVLTNVAYYSGFFSHSFFGGILGSITFYHDLAFNFGFTLQAGAELMDDDPVFEVTHDYPVYPQFWWILSYRNPPGIWDFISL